MVSLWDKPFYYVTLLHYIGSSIIFLHNLVCWNFSRPSSFLTPMKVITLKPDLFISSQSESNKSSVDSCPSHLQLSTVRITAAFSQSYSCLNSQLKLPKLIFTAAYNHSQSCFQSQLQLPTLKITATFSHSYSCLQSQLQLPTVTITAAYSHNYSCLQSKLQLPELTVTAA